MDGCDGADGGLDGLDMGSGSVAGLCGFDNGGWDGIDAIDILDGGSRELDLGGNVRVQPRSGLDVLDDGNLFAARVLRHGDADLKGILLASAERAGLLKVAPILVGQRELNQTDCSILPVNAWSGAKKGDMPCGYAAGMTGRTVMFRLFFQIPVRTWGPFSAPSRDKEACVYLDISGMTWTMNDGTGHSQSQLLVRVVPQTVLDSRSKLWCQRKTNVDAHRKVGQKLSQTVFAAVSHHAPAAEEEARLIRMSTGRSAVVHTPAPRPSPRQERTPVRTRSVGADLWSALVNSPQFNMAHTIAAAVPSSSNTMPHMGPVLETETIRVTLPRRTPASV